MNEKNINLVQYEWFKDNKPVDYNSKTVISNFKPFASLIHRKIKTLVFKKNLYKDGSLEITQVGEKDSGLYKCNAKFRSLIYESRQAFVKVNNAVSKTFIPIKSNSTTKQTIRPTPKFFLWPEDRNVQEDEEVIFECLAQNDPALSSDDLLDNKSYKYNWLKDGVALDLKPQNTNFISNNNKANAKRIQLVQGWNLRIEKAQESDSGTYTCRICNSGRDNSFLNGLDGVYETNSKNLDYLDTNIEHDECDDRSGSLKVLGIYFH